jgi:hypothetical protein
MTKRLLVVILLTLAVAGVAGGSLMLLLSNPLRRSEVKIRMSLLELAPVGSSEEQVRAVLDSVGLKHYPGRKDGDLFWRYRVDHDQSGESAICADLGSYTNLGEYDYFPWNITVRAIWVFDEGGRLIDLEVVKVIDSV